VTVQPLPTRVLDFLKRLWSIIYILYMTIKHDIV
jgi:hypothetical protein